MQGQSNVVRVSFGSDGETKAAPKKYSVVASALSNELLNFTFAHPKLVGYLLVYTWVGSSEPEHS